MQIHITKRGHRNVLTVVRDDGSRSSADVGPNLPLHDLAHYVVERTFNLRAGFFGNLAAGYTLQQLSDRDIIFTLGAESWLAEVLARGLGSLASGACAAAQFAALIGEELDKQNLPAPPPPPLTAATGLALLEAYEQLIARYRALADGETLQLPFD